MNQRESSLSLLTVSKRLLNPVSTSTISSDPVATTVRPAVKPQLLKLTLPKFRDVVMTWSSFWDSFKAAVHDDSIPKIDKFNYLNSSLEGLAARTVQGLTLTEGNYDSAVELLKERFGKPQQIISVHMDKLLRIPTCTGDRLSLLREVYGKVTVNVRGLSALGVGAEQYGSLLIPIIMAKLPNNVKLHIARETQEDVWKIEGH